LHYCSQQTVTVATFANYRPIFGMELAMHARACDFLPRRPHACGVKPNKAVFATE